MHAIVQELRLGSSEVRQGLRKRSRPVSTSSNHDSTLSSHATAAPARKKACRIHEINHGHFGLTRSLHTAELLDVFLHHAETLCPFTLARLAACSTECQGIIKLHIKAAADNIIPAAARQAQIAAATDQTQKLHSRALAWLCKTAGPAALTTPRLASQLVSIPSPAQFVVTALVVGGVRVPCDELVAAAKARVPGCEEWGKVLVLGDPGMGVGAGPLFAVSVHFEDPSLQLSLLVMIMSVCRFGRLAPFTLTRLHNLTLQHVVDLLHIALNTKDAAGTAGTVGHQNCASDLLRWLLRDTTGMRDAAPLTEIWEQHAAAMQQLQQHVNQPVVLRQLLQTAALRRHSEAAALLCRMCAISELSVGDATELIASALSTSSDDHLMNQFGCKGLQSRLLTVLCQNVPAARRLPVSCVAEMATQMIDGALSSFAHVSIQRPLLTILCGQLPAAKELPAYLLVDLIYKVIKHPEDRDGRWIQEKDGMLQTLVDLPAAQEIPQATAEDFLQKCLQQQVSYCLMRQPMQQLGAASVRNLLFEACDWYRLTQPLLNHPAVQHLAGDDVEQLLLAALANQEDTAVSILCTHAVAAKLSPAAVGRLIAAAVQLHSSIDAVKDILTLLRLGAVTIDDYLRAIRAAVQKADTAYLQAVLDSMHATIPDVAGRYALPEALRTAVLLGVTDHFKLVWQKCRGFDCGQPAAQEQVAAVVVTAILSGNPAAIRHVLDTVLAPPVKVWQQLLALAVLGRDRQAGLMLAGECFRQQPAHEPWLPDVLRLAIGGSKAGYAGEDQGRVDALAMLCQSLAGLPGAAGLRPLLPLQQQSMLHQQHVLAATNQGLQQQLQQLSWQNWQSSQGQGPQQVAQPQQQSVQPWLQPQGPELQQMLQLQEQEQQVFSEQCLQQVAGLMAAATRGTGATTFMVGWGSCWDARTGSPAIVMAAALQLLRSKTDPHALQLLGAALDQMESMVFPCAAAVWVAELLQVAVTASNADACGLLCNRKACEHIAVKHLSNMLMLAVQQLQYSPLPQRQQRMAVLQHVCFLFSRLNMFTLREWLFGDSSSAEASRVCVRQVLAAAVQAGDEQALQELLGVSSGFGCWQLLTYYDLYILMLMSLRTSCRPRIIQMLCHLRLSSSSGRGWGGEHKASAFTSMSVNRLYQLLRLALTTYKSATGVSEVVQLLAAWDPNPDRSVGRYASFSPAALGALSGQAAKIGDARERKVALEVLSRLCSPW